MSGQKCPRIDPTGDERGHVIYSGDRQTAAGRPPSIVRKGQVRRVRLRYLCGKPRPSGVSGQRWQGSRLRFPGKMGRCLRNLHPPSLAPTLWLTVVPGLGVLPGSHRILCPTVTQTQGLP